MPLLVERRLQKWKVGNPQAEHSPRHRARGGSKNASTHEAEAKSPLPRAARKRLMRDSRLSSGRLHRRDAAECLRGCAVEYHHRMFVNTRPKFPKRQRSNGSGTSVRGTCAPPSAHHTSYRRTAPELPLCACAVQYLFRMLRSTHARVPRSSTHSRACRETRYRSAKPAVHHMVYRHAWQPRRRCARAWTRRPHTSANTHSSLPTKKPCTARGMGGRCTFDSPQGCHKPCPHGWARCLHYVSCFGCRRRMARSIYSPA